MNSFYGNGGSGGASADQINNIIKQAIVVSQNEPVGQETGNLWIKITEKDGVTILWPSYVLFAPNNDMGAGMTGNGYIYIIKNKQIVDPNNYTVTSSNPEVIAFNNQQHSSDPNFFYATGVGEATITVIIDDEQYSSNVTVGSLLVQPQIPVILSESLVTTPDDPQRQIVVFEGIHVLDAIHAICKNDSCDITTALVVVDMQNSGVKAAPGVLNAQYYCAPSFLTPNSKISISNSSIIDSQDNDIDSQSAKVTLTGIQPGLNIFTCNLTYEQNSDEIQSGNYSFFSKIYVSNSENGIFVNDVNTPIGLNGIKVEQNGTLAQSFILRPSYSGLIDLYSGSPYETDYIPISSNLFTYQIADENIVEVSAARPKDSSGGYILQFLGKQVGQTTITLSYAWSTYTTLGEPIDIPITQIIPIRIFEGQEYTNS